MDEKNKKLELEEKALEDLIENLNVIPELGDKAKSGDSEEASEEIAKVEESEGEFCDACDSKPCKCEEDPIEAKRRVMLT